MRRAADLPIRIRFAPEPVVVHEEVSARAGEIVGKIDEGLTRHWQEADRCLRGRSALWAGSSGGFDVEPFGLGLGNDGRGNG